MEYLLKFFKSKINQQTTYYMISNNFNRSVLPLWVRHNGIQMKVKRFCIKEISQHFFHIKIMSHHAHTLLLRKRNMPNLHSILTTVQTLRIIVVRRTVICLPL